MHYSDIFAFTKMQKSYEFINQTRVKIAHVLFATKNTSGTIGYSLFLSPGILIIVLSFIALFTDKERTSRSMLLVAVILTLMLCPVFSWNWIPEKISVYTNSVLMEVVELHHCNPLPLCCTACIAMDE
jgi:hypothetical protein